MQTTTIIPISEGGPNTRSMVLFSQISKLSKAKFVLSDIKFMNTCSFTIEFKKISMCDRIMPSADVFSE